MKAAFNLEHSLAYRMNRAGVLIGSLMSEDLKRSGLTLTMWRVLVSLFHGGPQTLTELSDRTSVELYTVSRVAAALTRRAWVEREKCGDDKRAIRLRLSSAGRALTLKYLPIAQTYESAAVAGMTAAEAQRLKQQLERVYQNLTAVAAARPQKGARAYGKSTSGKTIKRS